MVSASWRCVMCLIPCLRVGCSWCRGEHQGSKIVSYPLFNVFLSFAKASDERLGTGGSV